MDSKNINNLPGLPQKLADEIIAALKDKYPDMEVIDIDLRIKNDIFNTPFLFEYQKSQ